jgi:uncharacterized protein (DUF1810 family)
MTDPFELQRLVDSQAPVYAEVAPQQRPQTQLDVVYAIASRDEAVACLKWEQCCAKKTKSSCRRTIGSVM